MNNMKSLPEADPEDIKNVITTNTYPQTLLTQEMIKRMLKRGQKSAIINLSSFSGGKPVSVCSTYSGTKGFNDFLSRASNTEFDDLDIMSVRPLWVSTPMTDHQKIGGFTISPEEHAKAALEKLGYDEWTNGHWKHALQYHLVYLIPDRYFQKKMLKKYRDMY